jgi:hypothetical protein
LVSTDHRDHTEEEELEAEPIWEPADETSVADDVELSFLHIALIGPSIVLRATSGPTFLLGMNFSK